MKLFSIIVLLLLWSLTDSSAQDPSPELEKIIEKSQQRLIYISKGDSLLYYLSQALELARKEELPGIEVHTLSRLAAWHQKNGDLEQAQEIVDQALELLPVPDNAKMRTILHFVQSEIYYDSRKYDESIDQKKKALKLAIKNNDADHGSLAAMQLAEVFFGNHLHVDSINKYLILADEIGFSNPVQQARLALNQGRYYDLIGNYNRAVEYITSAIDQAELIDDFVLARNANQILARLYESKGEYAKALAAQREYTRNLKIEIDRDAKVATLDMQRKLEAQQQQNQIDSLEAEKEIERLRNKRRLALLIFVLVILSLIVILSFVVIRINRKRRLSDRKLLDFQANMSAMRTRFYTNVSHEFRTPLTVIIGLCNQLAKQGIDSSLIRRNANHLLQLVTQLLDLSKSEVGQLKPNYIHGNIVTYIRYLTESFIPISLDQGKTLTINAEESVINMDYDAAMVKHINYNLLSNALKFSNPGDQITIHLKAEREKLIWKTVDTGIGMDPDTSRLVMNRWTQAKKSSDKGSGLGLSIVCEMLDLMGGTIKLDSTPDKGTAVILQLALRQESALKSQGRDNKPSPEGEGATLDKVDSGNGASLSKIALIAEDNADVREYIRSCLDSEFTVLEAEDGLQALSMAQEYIPDIIITDVMMPKMDGMSLTNAIKEDTKTCHIPVIVLSALADQDHRLEGLQHGADAYISKPFDEEELAIRMNQLIKLRNQLALKYSDLLKHTINSESKDPFLVLLQEKIEENYSDASYQVNELAADMVVSRMQLYRKLKAVTDHSPAEMLRSYRLHKARELLLQGDLNISQVAYSCGFSDPAYFSRVFSKTYDQSPTKFIKRHA